MVEDMADCMQFLLCNFSFVVCVYYSIAYIVSEYPLRYISSYLCLDYTFSSLCWWLFWTFNAVSVCYYFANNFICIKTLLFIAWERELIVIFAYSCYWCHAARSFQRSCIWHSIRLPGTCINQYHNPPSHCIFPSSIFGMQLCSYFFCSYRVASYL